MKKLLFFWLSCFGLSLQAEGIIETFVKEEALDVNHATFRFCSDEKAIEFASLVLQEKPDVCVEIGAFGGGSLLPVAVALKAIGQGVVIGIDPWNNSRCTQNHEMIFDEEDYSYWKSFDFSGLPVGYSNNISQRNLQNYVITFVEASEKVVSFIPTIDILHIDGAITEKASNQDVSLYLPLVRPGGYIWLSNAHRQERQNSLKMLEEVCELVKVIEFSQCALYRKKS